MKKSLISTVLFALFSVMASWAQFAPTEGKMYALKETTSGLYLDIQTLGIDEPGLEQTTSALTQNHVSSTLQRALPTIESGLCRTSMVHMQCRQATTVTGIPPLAGMHMSGSLTSRRPVSSP